MYSPTILFLAFLWLFTTLFLLPPYDLLLEKWVGLQEASRTYCHCMSTWKALSRIGSEEQLTLCGTTYVACWRCFWRLPDVCCFSIPFLHSFFVIRAMDLSEWLFWLFCWHKCSLCNRPDLNWKTNVVIFFGALRRVKYSLCEGMEILTNVESKVNKSEK